MMVGVEIVTVVAIFAGAAVALTVPEFKEMVGWLINRVICWITSLVGLVVVAIGVMSQFVSTVLGCNVVPRWAGSAITIGLIAAASLSSVPAWPIWVLVIVAAGCGVVGVEPLEMFNKAQEPPPVMVMGMGPHIYMAKKKEGVFSKVLKFPFKVVIFILTTAYKIVVRIVKFPVEVIRSLVLLLTMLFKIILGEMGLLTNKLWLKVYDQDAPYYEPTELGLPDRAQSDYPGELWIHVNGIMTNKEGGKRTCKRLYEMFGRPVGLLYNPTDGILPDLVECMAGKTGLLKYGCIEPRVELMKVLERKLRGAKDANPPIEKVVLIAHSQGTIITGNVISNLGRCEHGEVVDEELDRLMKELLEVYIIAGCAHHMPRNCKHLECMSNGGDIVAWLGHVFPNNVLKPIWRNTWGNGIFYSEDDASIIEHDLWGHMLDNHYLNPMTKGRYASSKLTREYLLSNTSAREATEIAPLIK